MKLILVIVLLVVVVGGGCGGYYYYYMAGADTLSFRTAPVGRGDLLATIAATGTVEPEDSIDVGAQVAGQIVRFGKDKDGKEIDNNSVVTAGMVLAEIDDTLYKADVDTAQAQLAQNKAAVDRAVADLGQMQAKLNQAKRDWDRAQKLGAGEALAQTSYDAYQSAYEVAVANVKVGDATIEQAKKAVDMAAVQLTRAQRNLSYCTITSPVDGTIIVRRVNIGQTVVASLNAPSLFLIAKDLRRMEILAPVNEADIGVIHDGELVTFRVDAYPGVTFKGTVGKVRLNASMTQNVVTYPVEIVIDNSDGKLKAYLTANVLFQVDEVKNALYVPKAALRFIPAPERIDPAYQAAAGSRKGGGKKGGDGNGGGGGNPDASGGNGGGGSGDKAAKGDGAAKTTGQRAVGTVWVVTQGKFVRPIKVKVGLSDDTSTQVIPFKPKAAEGEAAAAPADELAEGTEVIVGEQQKVVVTSTSNPFTPQQPSRSQPTATPTAGK
jgi:HlyD family secretion protein